MPKIGITILLVALFSIAKSQNYTIEGNVLDGLTKEPMMFTNVYIQGTTIGTTTDVNGNFSLKITGAYDSICTSSVGYKSICKKIIASNQKMVLSMENADFSINEVIVKSDETLEDYIVKRIIKNKYKNNPERFDSYSYETYNKMEIDLDEVSQRISKTKLMKPFSFIFDNVDSTSEEKPFLPIFLTESISDYYYRKNPKKTREVIKGTKLSGLKNESVNQFLGNMYQNFNVYDNWLPILGKNFVSPFSNDALYYYKYYLVDSVETEGKLLLKLKFKPKRKQENTFVGEFWVADTAFAIQQVSMQIEKEANINFVNKVAVVQGFSLLNDTTWFLTKDKLIVVFAATKKDSPGLIGRKTTTFKNIDINNKKIDVNLQGIDDIVVAENADQHPESYWQQVRHDSLSKNEKAIYAMVDTLKELPAFKTYVDFITVFATGYKVLGYIELGPYFNLYSNNIVEGHRFRLGFRTSNKLSTKYEIGAFAAYGTLDKKWKYGGHGIYVFSKYPRKDFYVRYYRDLDLANPNPNEFGTDNILSGLYRRPIPQKLSFEEVFTVSYFHELKFGYSNKISFLHKTTTPYFTAFFYDPWQLENRKIKQAPITTSELSFLGHFAYKEKFLSANIYRTSLGSKYPALDVTYTLGMSQLLGSQYTYHKGQVQVYDWFNIPPLGWSEYLIRGGKTFATLPMPLLDIMPGNETYFYNSFAFNLMNRYEFIADEYIYAMWNHHFEGLFLNKIPLLRKLKLRWLVSGKIAWGKLSNRNMIANNINGNLVKMLAPYPVPYSEAGIGLENIFKVFRVDGIWRLTYKNLPYASPFGVRVGLQLNF